MREGGKEGVVSEYTEYEFKECLSASRDVSNSL